MPKPDWRTPSAYEEIRKISATGFAWEFLRRNPDYRREYRRSHRAVDENELEAALRRWGLRFRGRPRAIGKPDAHLLVAGSGDQRPDALRRAA